MSFGDPLGNMPLFVRGFALAGAVLAPGALLVFGVFGPEGLFFPLRCLGACLAQESRRCLLMSLWLPTEIELHHYGVRSREEFLKRRRSRLRADGVEDAAGELARREAREQMNSCRSPGRHLRFLPVMDALKSMAWAERKSRFHSFGEMGRSHFITAVLEVNLATSEDEYLLEWIDFHTAAGIDHFVLYDAKNLSSTRQLLQPYTSLGIIDLCPCRPTADGDCVPPDQLVLSSGQQQQDFRTFAVTSLARQKSTFWIAQMDLDEFMFPRRQASLRDVLRPEMRPDGVQGFFIWQLNHGSAGWTQRPPMRQLEAYTKCSPQRDWNGKSLAQADSIVLTGPQRYSGSPHVLLAPNSAARVCDAHLADFGGRAHCLSNPVLLFDAVSFALCAAGALASLLLAYGVYAYLKLLWLLLAPWARFRPRPGSSFLSFLGLPSRGGIVTAARSFLSACCSGTRRLRAVAIHRFGRRCRCPSFCCRGRKTPPEKGDPDL